MMKLILAATVTLGLGGWLLLGPTPDSAPEPTPPPVEAARAVLGEAMGLVAAPAPIYFPASTPKPPPVRPPPIPVKGCVRRVTLGGEMRCR